MGIVVIGAVAYLFDLLMRYVERLRRALEGQGLICATGARACDHRDFAAVHAFPPPARRRLTDGPRDAPARIQALPVSLLARPRHARERCAPTLWPASIGALVVLPQAVAYATLAGLPPRVRPLLRDAAGRRRRRSGGRRGTRCRGRRTRFRWRSSRRWRRSPTPGSPAYIELVLTLALLVGLLQLAMGIARLGTLVNFISHTVIVGFTAGAGLLIIAAQLRTSSAIPIPAGDAISSRACARSVTTRRNRRSVDRRRRRSRRSSSRVAATPIRPARSRT